MFKKKSTMIQLKKIQHLPEPTFRALGWEWLINADNWNYLTSELLPITEVESEEFYENTNLLYKVMTNAAQHVIQHNYWKELDIPYNMVELIKYTWNDRKRHIHLYSRFDIAGGIDGLPPKLLEFNADTPTSVPETAVIQWAQLKANEIAETHQFNFLHEALVAQFELLKKNNPDLSPTLLLSSMRESAEDDANVDLIADAATTAGFEVEFRYVDEVVFSPNEGIFVDYGWDKFKRFSFWFKLVPWEYIANDEPQLLDILSHIILGRRAVVLNPPYSLLLQSKGLLKYAWDTHKYHDLLLATSFEEPLRYEKYVKKVLFGREGANVSIFDEVGNQISTRDGDYLRYRSIYQSFAQLGRDPEGRYYQAGVFYAGEACGLGFRRGGLIIDNGASFVGHVIE